MTYKERDRQCKKSKNIFCIFYNVLLYSWFERWNIKKVTSLTDWPSEWQTENASNIKIFNIEKIVIN